MSVLLYRTASPGIAGGICAHPRDVATKTLAPTSAWTPGISVWADVVPRRVARVIVHYRRRSGGRGRFGHAAYGPRLSAVLLPRPSLSEPLRGKLRVVALARPYYAAVQQAVAYDGQGAVVARFNSDLAR